MTSLETAHEALALALGKKALNPLLLDMTGLVSYTDYFLICSGTSTQHVKAIVDGIEEALSERKVKPLGIEGRGFGHWVLLDYGGVVIHVFEERTREYYELEKLWLDAPRLEIDEDPDNMAGKDKAKVSG